MARTKKRKPKYKSNLEVTVANLLPSTAEYESEKIKYIMEHEYTPDFTVGPRFFIEVKGYWQAADRAKHLLIKKQHPDITICFLFGNPKNKLHRLSKTTYAEWCDKHGFEWTDLKKGIPKHWIQRKEINGN